MEQKERKKHERPESASSSRRNGFSNCFSCRSYSSNTSFVLLVLLSVQNFPTESFMTLLGNFVEMSGQEEQDPFKWNKRSGRSMRGKNQRLHQEGMGSRTASHAVHTPPIHPLFSLFSCPYKISQQSHLSCTPPIDRP